MRILIVDDCADIKCMGILEECMERRIAVEIERAVNPALRRIRKGERKIDGIVLDMGLPRYEKERITSAREGESVLRELKRKKSEIPVLIFSDTPLEYFGYEHVFDQMKNWYTEEEAKKFYRFLEKLQKEEQQ